MQMNVYLISIIGNIKPNFLCPKLSICPALLTKGASFPPRGVLPPAPPGSPTFSQPHRAAVALFIHVQVPLSGSSMLGGRRESLLPSPLKLCGWEAGRGNTILLSFDQMLVQEGQLGPDIGVKLQFQVQGKGDLNDLPKALVRDKFRWVFAQQTGEKEATLDLKPPPQQIWVEGWNVWSLEGATSLSFTPVKQKRHNNALPLNSRLEADIWKELYDDGAVQKSSSNTALLPLLQFLERLLCLTPGECNSQQPLPLIQHIWLLGGPLDCAGRSPGRLQYGCQSRRVTVWLIRALLICTALISRLSLLQSGRLCAFVGAHTHTHTHTDTLESVFVFQL